MKQKILVIEDHAEVRENIMELLELSGYDAVGAANGKLGVQKALKEHPNLILCDIMMPELDGFETLYILSKNAETASTPFIFLTAKAEKGDFRKGMNMGADDYITKPFDEMELLGAVERRLARFEKISADQDLETFLTSANQYPGLEQLKGKMQTKKYKKGDVLYRQGDYANFAYKVVRGKIKSYQLNEDGKELLHHIFTPGEFMGEKELINQSDHHQFAQAMEETEVQVIPRDLFQDLLHQNREVAGQFIKMLAQNLVEQEQKIVEMAYDSVRKRTADALVELHNTYQNKEGFRISRADLASMVGTATESVIRILSEFKKDGYLEIKGSNIRILQLEKLQHVPF